LSHLREQGLLPPTDALNQGQGSTDLVWLGDSMGEMPFYYGLADIALLGGSFAPLGGQNLIEAAACGCPVVMGPHTFNFAEAAELAEAAGAALRAADMAAAVLAAANLARQPSLLRRAHRAAEAYVGSQRGAAERTVQACARLLAERAPKASTPR
jgi:3-deoxy-D-manno-octulosonic-acid transferase